MRTYKFDPKRISDELYVNFCKDLDTVGYPLDFDATYQKALFNVCYNKIVGRICVRGNIDLHEFNDFIDDMAFTAACTLLNPTHLINECEWNGYKLLHSAKNKKMFFLYGLIEAAGGNLTETEQQILGTNFHMIKNLKHIFLNLDLAA